MWRLLLCLTATYLVPFNIGSLNLTDKQKVNEDYYLSYDYELTNNFSAGDNLDMHSDALIFPNPKLVELGYSVDIMAKVDLPDDSLAESDLRDHNFIDNLMYVYYGSRNRIESTYGPEIVFIGALLSCLAQSLTILCLFLSYTPVGKLETKKLFLQFMFWLWLSHIILLVGVHSTKNLMTCQMVAIFLHFSYLLASTWILMYCFYIYNSIVTKFPTSKRTLVALSFAFPTLVILITFFVPESYETKNFCFLSVEKGMMTNYMIPVGILIFATTFLAINGIRKFNVEISTLDAIAEGQALEMFRRELEGIKPIGTMSEILFYQGFHMNGCKSAIRNLCILQTSLDVVWFLTAMALDNIDYTLSLPFWYASSSVLLNWYIFAKRETLCPNINFDKLPEVIVIDKEKDDSESSFLKHSSDNIPLLVNVEIGTGTENPELRVDSISTISIN